jgi:hypothetical protein
MLNLDGEAPRLLICIDEVSKLVDDDSSDRCWTSSSTSSTSNSHRRRASAGSRTL